MKIELTLTEVEIKQAIDAWLRSKRPELIKGYPIIQIDVSRNNNGEFQAIASITEGAPGSGDPI